MSQKAEKEAMHRWSAETEELELKQTKAFLDELESAQMYSFKGLFRPIRSWKARRAFEDVLLNNMADLRAERAVGEKVYFSYAKDVCVVKGTGDFRACRIGVRIVFGVKNGREGTSTIFGDRLESVEFDSVDEGIRELFDSIHGGTIDAYDYDERSDRTKIKTGRKVQMRVLGGVKKAKNVIKNPPAKLLKEDK